MTWLPLSLLRDVILQAVTSLICWVVFIHCLYCYSDPVHKLHFQVCIFAWLWLRVCRESLEGSAGPNLHQGMLSILPEQSHCVPLVGTGGVVTLCSIGGCWRCSHTLHLYMQCGKAFTSNDITILYGTEEDIKRQSERMEERRQQEKMTKVSAPKVVCVRLSCIAPLSAHPAQKEGRGGSCS